MIEFLQDVKSVFAWFGFYSLLWLVAKWVDRNEIGYSKEWIDRIRRYRQNVEYAQRELDHWKGLLETAEVAEEERFNKWLTGTPPVGDRRP